MAASQEVRGQSRAETLLRNAAAEAASRRNKGPIIELVLIAVIAVFVFVIGDRTECYLPLFRFIAETNGVDLYADEGAATLAFLLIAMGLFSYRRWMECKAEVIVQTRDFWTLHSLNDEMEVRVRERTMELDRMNQTLLKEIDERKRMEESLILFRALIDRSSDGIEVIDPESGQFLDVNETTCERLKYSREELLSMRVTDVSNTTTNPSKWKNSMENLRKTGFKIIESNHRRKDGSIFPVEVHARYVELNRKYVLSVVRDITERRKGEAELEKAHRDLVSASRHAGMAEIATGVLHNVGNVLNSLNVSTSLLAEHVRTTPVAELGRVATLLREQGPNLGSFFASDPRAPKVVDFLTQLAEMFSGLQATKLGEVASIQKNIDHIKEIVVMQQDYASVSGLTETLSIEELVEDTLRINAANFMRHKVEVAREFAPELPAISTEKHKVMQILLNLVSNAKSACGESPRADKRIRIKVTHADGRMRVAVIDNGMGISPANLAHIFEYGFTTKKDGHGFGLHNSANTAKEIGGTLTVQSDGEQCGATFALELPLNLRK